jgi:hypothetical protein
MRDNCGRGRSELSCLPVAVELNGRNADRVGHDHFDDLVVTPDFWGFGRLGGSAWKSRARPSGPECHGFQQLLRCALKPGRVVVRV